MAMKPFAGYNFGDYWAHWLSLGNKLECPPKIFHVNWFRRDAAGKFLWPGFSENLRVIEWVLKRCAGKVGAQESAIGNVPISGDLNLQGVDVMPDTMKELLAVPNSAWRKEIAELRLYLWEFGDRLPSRMLTELDNIEQRLAF